MTYLKTPTPEENAAYVKEATAWAAKTLTAKGCTLHDAGRDGWDVETPRGWRTARNWRELCVLAQEVRAK